MSSKKILLIEDDKSLTANVQTLLKEEGYEVKTTDDGEIGISVAKQWKPDLILCDISIPSKDGYEVLKELSKNVETKIIPFIFLTARVEKEDLRKGMLLGADDYIFKPFNLNDLLESIRVRLEKSALIKIDGHEQENSHTGSYELNDKILLNTGKRTELIAIKDIKYIKADTPYVLLKFSNGKNSLQRKTLDEWEAKLPEKIFLRIHRSTIINTEFISKIEKMNNFSYIVRLEDETEPFIISKRYSAKLRNRFA